MLRFLAAIAVVLAVLTAGALIVAAAVSRAAPLAARLEAWWARRSTPIVTAGGPDGKARDRVGRNEAVVGLAAAQGDDDRAPAAGDGFGGGSGFGDGGAGAVDGGDGGG